MRTAERAEPPNGGRGKCREAKPPEAVPGV